MMRRFTNNPKKTEKKENFVERRESPRYRVILWARSRGDGEFYDYRGNVGIGGFFFHGDEVLKEGTEMEVFFQIPGSCTWILARGEVLGKVDMDWGVGIRGRFTEITFEKERNLARWIDTMSQRFQAA
jgi:hypothetical protein